MHGSVGVWHIGFKGGPPKVAMRDMLERENGSRTSNWTDKEQKTSFFFFFCIWGSYTIFLDLGTQFLSRKIIQRNQDIFRLCCLLPTGSQVLLKLLFLEILEQVISTVTSTRFLSFTIRSVNLSTWPEAFNTTSGATHGQSTSNIFSSRTKHWCQKAGTLDLTTQLRGP